MTKSKRKDRLSSDLKNTAECLDHDEPRFVEPNEPTQSAQVVSASFIMTEDMKYIIFDDPPNPPILYRRC